MQIIIEPSQSKLKLYKDNSLYIEYQISTSKNGLGEEFGSEKTPRGQHIIRAKIGNGVPLNSVFVARRPTGEIYSPILGEKYKDRDWILSRILWLSGLEKGKNKFGNCDTMRRFIYIHGAPDELDFSVNDSHGCIRMKNNDIVELFDLVDVGTKVVINE